MASFPLPPGEPALYPNTAGGFTAPDLADWQWEYNDLVLGVGQSLGVLKAEGFGALPNIGSQDIPFPRDTGEWQGVDAMAGRDPILDLFCSTSIFEAFTNVGAACAVNPYSVLPLWFQLPSFEILCTMCRPRKRTSTWDTLVAAQAAWYPTLTWHANDPRLYGQGQVADCPSGSTTVSFSVDNAGNAEMRPVIVLTGPLAKPAIYNESIAGSPGIVFQDGVSVTSGDQMVIDLDPLHLITYYVNGIASPSARVPVYNWLDFAATTWWNLPAGTNDLTGTVGSGSIAADAFEVWWSDAYLL